MYFFRFKKADSSFFAGTTCIYWTVDFFHYDTSNITRRAGTIFWPATKSFVSLKRQVIALGNTHISPLWRHHWRAGAMVHIQLLRNLVSFRIMWTVFFGVRHSITLVSVLMASVFILRSLWCSKWNLFANSYSKMFSSPPLAIPLPCQIFIGQKKKMKWKKNQKDDMQCYERKKKAVTEDQWQGFQISCYLIRINLLESSPVLKLEMGSWPFTGTNTPPPGPPLRYKTWKE